MFFKKKDENIDARNNERNQKLFAMSQKKSYVDSLRGAPMATSKSPTCGQVKIPQARQQNFGLITSF